MNPQLYVQNDEQQTCPAQRKLQQWVAAALAEAGSDDEAELTIRIVPEQEMQQLNQRYRDQPGVTNVLSFAAQLPPELQLPLLGDIVICAAVVEREATEQGKTADAHWAHMVVHGTLHLLGYDHIEEGDAETMERLEARTLDKLQFPPPYESTSQAREQSATP